MKHDVDIIIVNYNGINFLDTCLKSLFNTAYSNFHVIVVDNGSTDGSKELLKKNYPSVELISNKKNLGFGTACTIGVQAGQAEFIAFLNNDTEVDTNWLKPLVDALRQDNNTAAVCSKLLFMHNRNVINSAGGGMNYLAFGYDIGMFQADNGKFNEDKEVFFPCAASCLVRRDAFDEVGGFDSKFFMYHEDVDLGWRLRLKGYRIKYIPQSIVYHAFGGTSLKVSSMAFRNNLGYRHAMRSILKNYELSNILKILPLFLSIGIKTGIKDHSFKITNSLLWNLRNLPNTLAQRRFIQENRKISDKVLSFHIWQKKALPVSYPDYKQINLITFQHSNNKRNLLDTSLHKLDNLGYGWYPIEEMFDENKTIYRWSKDEALIYLWNKSKESEIILEVLGLAKTLDRNRRFQVIVNGKQEYDFLITSDDWETKIIPYINDEGTIELKIKVCDTFRPHDFFFNNDIRNLGIGIKKAEVRPKIKTNKEIDGVSVIIPTYNRSETLLKTLKALASQTLSRNKYEVVIVDDGSTDSTEKAVKNFIETTQIKIKYLKQPNKKQAAARNLGIKNSTMPLLIFIGDDIIPEKDFLYEHYNYHKQYNLYGSLALIGYTRWSSELKITPFMQYIEHFGYQFCYSLIKENIALPFNFFYTSNISIMRDFIESIDHAFDEAFDIY
ncbi:Glycosyl transferase, family 2 domain protein, partial [Candidatus Magnetoovum chiemensis]